MNDNKMKDIIKAEYLKCAQDPVYFLKKYAVIQHPMRGKVPFFFVRTPKSMKNNV